MSLFFKISIITLFIFTSLRSSSQTAKQNDLIENIIENIAEENEENLDYTNLLEEITLLINNPINLNTAERDDLLRLYFLNQNHIDNLIKYRTTGGEIYSLYELQLIPGFSFELIKNIEPLICLKLDSKQIQIRKKAQHIAFLKSEYTFEKEKGYNTDNANSKYQGNAWKYYTRLQSKIPNKGLEYGITAEKDKGETFFEKDNNQGFDFYSAHLQIKRSGFFKQINIGDYQVKFGQGVSLWSGLGGGKSSFTTQNARKYQGIRGYKSTDENKFLRGLSLLLHPTKKIKLALFASSKKIDASTDIDTTSAVASSIINTGFHRNLNEIDKEDQVKEKIFGSYLILNLKNIETGISYLQYNYSPEVSINEDPYAVHNFSGKSNSILSFTYQTQINSIHFYGEAAKSKSGGMGILQGANIQVHPQLNLEAIFRKYDENYHAHYSNSFSEQTRSQNEEGIYLGLNFHPLPKWTIKAYYDQFWFPWLRYSVDSPSDGHEYFSQIEFTPNEKVSVYFRFKQENKAENYTDETVKYPLEIQKNQYRFHLSAKPASNWEIRNRLEFSQFKKNNLNENGFLIYQDIIYRFPQIPLRMSMRYALFDTDSYDTRIYAYENDVLYAYSVPAYYLKGSRFYINLNYKIDKKISLYTRYSQTKYQDVESIGSGTSEINGNTKSDFKILLRIKF